MTFSKIQKSQLEGALRLDAECYQPEYLDLNERLKVKNSKLLGDLAEDIVCGPFGSAILQEDYQEKGVPLVRVADLNDWFVRDNSLVFIDEALSQKMGRYRVVDGDLAVSQRGTIAMFSKITDKFSTWNISANLISIKKSDKVNFGYLLAFLNSYYGINQLYRRLSGQVQAKITTDDVKQILVFVPNAKKQKEIAKLIHTAWQERERSRFSYFQAENLLLEKLGLMGEKFEDELSYVVDSSDVKSADRTDANYFQPKYKGLISKIKNQNAKLLGDLVLMKKGVEVGSEVYQEEGKPFIRVSNLSKHGFEGQNQKYLNENLYHKLKENFEPKVGEILLTKDATPGIAYVLKESLEGVIAGGILRLEPNSRIDPEYLALVLNSIIGQTQIERDAGGSVILHWRPEQIKNCLVPILPKSIQQKIANLVHRSHTARRKAKELLKKAKKEVEEMIEK